MKNDQAKISELGATIRSTMTAPRGAEDHAPQARPTPTQCLANGTVGSASVVNTYTRSSVVNPMDLLAQLQQDAQAIHAGDLRQVEAMLMNQAVALQSMFTDFALLSAKQTSTAAMQSYAQLALRAQAGCRATLQTLAEVKNPRQVAFVRQTNVAKTQQVNNGTTLSSCAKSHRFEPNELLVEEQHGSQKMDYRAKATTSGIDPEMGALDAVHRSSKRQR